MAQKTVLITGASRGIGKALALKFASQGCRISINCLTRTGLLAALTEELRLTHTPVCSSTGDVGDYGYARRLVQETTEALGPIDILINNAGIASIGLFSELSPAEWDRILRTNLTSVYNLSSLCIPGMVRRKSGKILNISSVWGVAGASCEAAYSAAKGGVNALTRALAKELAPSGIQVNAIACGAIDTDMNACLGEEGRAALLEEIPAGRMGSPEEVAELAWKLCDGCSYLNGQVINLDGGWL